MPPQSRRRNKVILGAKQSNNPLINVTRISIFIWKEIKEERGLEIIEKTYFSNDEPTHVWHTKVKD
jgi:hypothetical protein